MDTFGNRNPCLSPPPSHTCGLRNDQRMASWRRAMHGRTTGVSPGERLTRGEERKWGLVESDWKTRRCSSVLKHHPQAHTSWRREQDRISDCWHSPRPTAPIQDNRIARGIRTQRVTIAMFEKHQHFGQQETEQPRLMNWPNRTGVSSKHK